MRPDGCTADGGGQIKVEHIALFHIPQTATTTAKSPPHAGGPKAINLGGAGAEPLPLHPPAQPSILLGSGQLLPAALDKRGACVVLEH